MASLLALRAVLGASLGLGAVDLVWLNVGLAPQVLAPEAAAPEPSPAPIPAPIPGPTPAPVIASAPASEPILSPTTPAPLHERAYFATGVARLDPAAREVIDGAVRAAGPEANYVLEGHADHRGDERFNHELGARRALAVRAELEGLGVPRTKIRVSSAGEASATADGELWRDRRVDLYINGRGQR